MLIKNKVAPADSLPVTRRRSSSFYASSSTKHDIEMIMHLSEANSSTSKKKTVLEKFKEAFSSLANRFDRFFSKTSNQDKANAERINHAKKIIEALLQRNAKEIAIIEKKRLIIADKTAYTETLKLLNAEKNEKLHLAMILLSSKDRNLALKKADTIFSDWFSHVDVDEKELLQPREDNEILYRYSLTAQYDLCNHLLKVLNIVRRASYIEKAKLMSHPTEESLLAQQTNHVFDQWGGWIDRLSSFEKGINPDPGLLFECINVLNRQNKNSPFSEKMENIKKLYIEKNKIVKETKPPLSPKINSSASKGMPKKRNN